jgi:hypothetical protein
MEMTVQQEIHRMVATYTQHPEIRTQRAKIELCDLVAAAYTQSIISRPVYLGMMAAIAEVRGAT